MLFRSSLWAEVAEKPHTGAAVDELVARHSEHGLRLATQPRRSERPARQQRLHVSMAQSGRWLEYTYGVRRALHSYRLDSGQSHEHEATTRVTAQEL